MSIKENKELVREKISILIDRILTSRKMYEINIKEEKLNDEYENIEIKIRKVDE